MRLRFCSAKHPGEHVYVGSYSLTLQVLIDTQLCRMRTTMWRSLQTIRKAGVPSRLHEGRPVRLNFSFVLDNYRLPDILKNICAPH